jgi:hypothetical protein
MKLLILLISVMMQPVSWQATTHPDGCMEITGNDGRRPTFDCNTGVIKREEASREWHAQIRVNDEGIQSYWNDDVPESGGESDWQWQEVPLKDFRKSLEYHTGVRW